MHVNHVKWFGDGRIVPVERLNHIFANFLLKFFCFSNKPFEIWVCTFNLFRVSSWNKMQAKVSNGMIEMSDTSLEVRASDKSYHIVIFENEITLYDGHNNWAGTIKVQEIN